MNTGKYRALQIISLTLLSLFLLTQVAVAESDPLISFESEETITFSYDVSKADDPESSQNDDLVVRVFNNTAESFTLDIQLRDFGSEDRLSEVLSIDHGKTAVSLNGAELAELFFLVAAQDWTENKTYTGELYVTAEGMDGATNVAVIHQKLSLEVTAVQPTPTSLTLQNSPSYLTEVVFEGTNSQPTVPLLLIILSLAALLAAYFLWERAHRTVVLIGLIIAMLGVAGAFFIGDGVKIEPIVLEGAAASDSETQVGFVTANSQIVPIAQDGSQYSVKGISEAGHYTGNIDLLPDDKDKAGGIVVKVNVKDAWPYALLTIALGTLVGFLIKDYYTTRPLRLLETDYEKEEASLARAIDNLPEDIKVLGKQFKGLLKKAKADFGEEITYAQTTNSLENAQTLVKNLKAYANALAKFNATLLATKRLIPDEEGQRKYAACVEKLIKMGVFEGDFNNELAKSDLQNLLKEVESLKTEFTGIVAEELTQELQWGEKGDSIAATEGEDGLTYPQAVANLKRDDRNIAILAALLAVITGFATLYTKSDVTFWGTPGSYLTAFLWGAGVAEGSKLALDFVTAIWKKADK